MIGKPAPAEDRAGSKPATAKDDAVTTPAARLRHVVFFKFKAGTTPEKLKEITDAFAELPTKIDAIRDFEWGTDVSVENLSKGFTHCFFVTFDDEKGRDAYLPHPAHKAFVDIVKPCLEDVCVVDYRETRPKPATAKESK
ncbi:MAG: Dabb family protein [Planctomycetia bacterium]|nr:Dabb family protein [Planctomycetia bacterium]